MDDQDDMQKRGAEPSLMRVPSFTTPAMDRAVELARELLRQRGYSEEQIDEELNRPPGSGLPSL